MRPTQKILTEYAERRARVTAERDERVRAAYSALPRLAEIDDEKKALTLSCGRALLADDPVRQRECRERIAALNSERAALLAASGMDETFLEPRWYCPACRDTGFTDAARLTPCECMKRRLMKDAYASSNIKNGESFAGFRTDIFPSPRQKKLTSAARDLLEKYSDAFPENAVCDVLLIGAPGLGKTFLANCVAERVLSRGFDAVKLTAYNLVNAYMLALRDRTAPPDLTSVDLLVIDDLGTEPMIPNITLEYLFSIVNERQSARRATVIATNLSTENLLDRYGERLFSRLTAPSLVNVLILEGEDVRR